MRHIRLLLFLLLTWGAQAQSEYAGSVVDAETGQPIPFVNVGVVGRSIGTVSDVDGSFLLELPPNRLSGTDLIRISSLGYEPVVLPFARFQEQKDRLVFRLQQQPISLQEVVLTNLPGYQVEEEVGYPGLSGKGIGYWKDSAALGGELRLQLTAALERGQHVEHWNATALLVGHPDQGG